MLLIIFFKRQCLHEKLLQFFLGSAVVCRYNKKGIQRTYGKRSLLSLLQEYIFGTALNACNFPNGAIGQIRWAHSSSPVPILLCIDIAAF